MRPDRNHRRLHLACWAGLMVVALMPAIGAAQPGSDSEAAKYPTRPATPQKPELPPEPNPKMDCPWLDHIVDNEPMMSSAENREEFLAFNYFVTYARRFSPELMARHTRKELTFRRLFEEGQRYRGEIVRVEGRLKRLNWIGSNKQLEADGVKDLYEAWVFGEHYFSNPTCVVLSELPPGLEPKEDMADVKVAVDGYYFKRYKYKAVNDTRLAPLVIARTLTVTTPPAAPEDPGKSAFGRLFLPVVLSLLLGMVAFAFIMHRWFRVGDRRAHEALKSIQSSEFIAPTETPPPPKPRAEPGEPSWN